jgi:beta-lactamase regulating signal transducer with metallopeptidase domain
MDALANWFWQGGAVAAAATLLLRTSKQMSATTRYRLWWIALVAVLALPGISWASAVILSSRGDALEVVTSSAPAAPSSAVPAIVTGVVLPAPPLWVGAVLMALWGIWMSVSIVRTAAAFVALRRAKRTVRTFPDARERNLPTWRALRVAGRPVRLVLSNDVRAAAVLGLNSPAIAVAPDALQALDDTELDQIVVHEWAHVQRRDDVARLIQRLVIAVAGLHPAVWWIDRQLNLERETACDDWAVNATGSRRSLAVCLTKLASLTGSGPNAVLMPAALLPSELSMRVLRLLDEKRNRSTRGTLRDPLLVTTVLGAIAFTVASVELVVTSTLTIEPPKYAAPVTAEVPAQADGRSAARLPMTRSVGKLSTKPAGRTRIASGSSPQSTHGHARQQQPSERNGATGTSRQPATAERADQAATPAAAAPTAVVAPNHPIDYGGFDSNALPGTSTPLSATLGESTANPVASQESQTPWGAAAAAGVTVGKRSQKAATATAGFFSRLSKSIAGSF